MTHKHKSLEVSKQMIPYGKHFIDEDDIQAVTEVLRNGWLTQGPKVSEFEVKIAEYVGAKFAIAVSSGTAALHLSALVLDLPANCKVITSNNTFVATANCIRYVGCKPLLCDIEEDSLNMDPVLLGRLLKKHPRVGAIIPVHFAGLPCDMKSISCLVKNNSIKIIEDASHALGAKYEDGGRVGNCKFSDLTVFSLHPVKGVTAGEGGVITTNDEVLYKRLQMLRSHGICKGNFDLPGVSKPGDDLFYKDKGIESGKLNPWYYEMQSLGFNYRITDIQCALALSQLNKLDIFIKRRKEIVRIYDDNLKNLQNISSVQIHKRANSAHHIYVIRIDFLKLKKSRGDLMRELLKLGIGTQVHYIPVARHPYYAETGYKAEDYPNTENYYSEALSIPLYFGISNSQIKYILKCLREALN